MPKCSLINISSHGKIFLKIEMGVLVRIMFLEELNIFENLVTVFTFYHLRAQRIKRRRVLVLLVVGS